MSVQDRKQKFLIVGSGGREGAFALNLAQDTVLFAVIDHANPTIVECVRKTGGQYVIGNSADPKTVLAFAQQHNVDYVFVSADEPLAKGVVDSLLQNNIKAIGGTQAATRIEWDKIYSIEMVHATSPEATPFFITVATPQEVPAAIQAFQAKGLEIVVKPQGLTGGKGVKVMPDHLESFAAAQHYTNELLEKNPGERVLLVEKLHGIEFTIMGLTDGQSLVLAPASYDYPFRLDGDRGAGTGGMGCFTARGKKLPFMTDAHLAVCRQIMQRIIDQMRHDGLFFNGVLNGGFFITSQGVRFMEFNGRFGDPEGLNILSILKGSLAELLKDVWHKRLSEERVAFVDQASVIKYLVAAEYPNASPTATDFAVDVAALQQAGIKVFFSSCIQTGPNQYQTLKKSRVVALGALADTIEAASLQVESAIKNHVRGALEYRQDIGSAANLAKLSQIAAKFTDTAHA